MGRILAVDPGEKRLGLALSDPTATIASPLAVLKHNNRRDDAEGVIRLAEENAVDTILIGFSLDEEGIPKPIGRHAQKLAEEIRSHTEIPVKLWDEHGSTITARKTRIEMGVKRSKRSGHLDDLAAAVILQSYLDAMSEGLAG